MAHFLALNDKMTGNPTSTRSEGKKGPCDAVLPVRKSSIFLLVRICGKILPVRLGKTFMLVRKELQKDCGGGGGERGAKFAEGRGAKFAGSGMGD
jgi:hypothetical protein